MSNSKLECIKRNLLDYIEATNILKQQQTDEQEEVKVDETTCNTSSSGDSSGKPEEDNEEVEEPIIYIDSIDLLDDSPKTTTTTTNTNTTSTADMNQLISKLKQKQSARKLQLQQNRYSQHVTQLEKTSLRNHHDYHMIDEFGEELNRRSSLHNHHHQHQNSNNRAVSPSTNSVESFEFISLNQRRPPPPPPPSSSQRTCSSGQRSSQHTSQNEHNIASYEKSWDANPTLILLNSLNGKNFCWRDIV